MTIPTTYPFQPTSAAGAMQKRPIYGPIIIGCLLAGLQTSTAGAAQADSISWSSSSVEQTTAGSVLSRAQPAGAAIGEVRRLTGLTWDQLARVFSVSRRSLHFWASGKPMTSANEERLQRLVAVARKIYRGTPSATRAALLNVRDGGIIPFDLLVEGSYDRLVALLGYGEASSFSPPSPSEEGRTKRSYLAPEDLIGALQDRIHRESGVIRTARSVKVRSGR